jgi:protein SCO1/2
VFFGFTHCPDLCPTTLGKLALLRKSLGPRAANLTIVFIGLDPERDHPQALQQYAAQFQGSVLALSGTLAEVKRAAEAFHVVYRKVPLGTGDYTLEHTATVFLLGPSGRIVDTISTSDSRDQAIAKLRRLVEPSTT